MLNSPREEVLPGALISVSCFQIMVFTNLQEERSVMKG